MEISEEFKAACEELKETAEKHEAFGIVLYKVNGYLVPGGSIPGVVYLNRCYSVRDSDIFLASLMKSGTTWLKALTFAIVYRHCYPSVRSHPLLDANPHELLPHVDPRASFQLVYDGDTNSSVPRILPTHYGYEILPDSVKAANTKIIYVARNPLDVFVSAWHFLSAMPRTANSDYSRNIEAFFDVYCQGFHHYGPWSDHLLGYWKASLERPDNVLFLKYEDLKLDVDAGIKQMAQFIGCPFSPEEEADGKVEDIARLCSFDNLKEANKSGNLATFNITKSSFFRKGQVGDWVNFLSPSMVECFDKIVHEKLDYSGLIFPKLLISDAM